MSKIGPTCNVVKNCVQTKNTKGSILSHNFLILFLFLFKMDPEESLEGLSGGVRAVLPGVVLPLHPAAPPQQALRLHVLSVAL